MLFKELHSLFPGVGSRSCVLFGRTSCSELYPWSRQSSLQAWPIRWPNNRVASVRVDMVSEGERMASLC
jgi:hypothetical protein